MYILCSVNKPFVQCFYIVHFHSFQVGIYQYGCRVVTNHATSVSGACPFGEESAFLVGIDETFLHLLVHRRIH